MGKDLRQVGFNRNLYPDRCYLYPSTAVEKNKLKVDAKPICRFNKRDLVSFQWERLVIGGVVSNSWHFVGTIQTPDHVEEARPDMYVVDQTGMLFIIDAPVISDDANESKVVGRRPSILTTMKLVGVEKRNG